MSRHCATCPAPLPPLDDYHSAWCQACSFAPAKRIAKQRSLALRLDNLEWFIREVHQLSPDDIAEMRGRKERRESSTPPPDPADMD